MKQRFLNSGGESVATIALYAGEMNRMSSLTGEVRKSVDDYSSELFSLKSKALNIRKSVCNLDDVIGMIQASTEIQEKKIESLENFSKKTEEFTAEVVRIDEGVAAVINQYKEEFYNKYDYLKPDAEKNFLEICFDSAAEWCKEHWKQIVTTVGIIVGAALAIAAVAATGGVALVPLLTALGVAAGTAANISLSVAAIAAVSTIGAATLNIVDVWGKIDNPTFNTLQSALNWTSTITNGLYDIGMLYNAVRYKFGGSFNRGSKGACEADGDVNPGNFLSGMNAEDAKKYLEWNDLVKKGLSVEERYNLSKFGSIKTQLDYTTSTGLKLQGTTGKTTTIIGNYNDDMKYIVDELGNIKSTNFGSKNGGFNILNVPDEEFSRLGREGFWKKYNEPWLQSAIDRNDIIKVATYPGDSVRYWFDADSVRHLTGYGRELQVLEDAGYIYDSIIHSFIK